MKQIVIPVVDADARKVLAGLREVLTQEATAAARIFEPRADWLRQCAAGLRIEDVPEIPATVPAVKERKL